MKRNTDTVRTFCSRKNPEKYRQSMVDCKESTLAGIPETETVSPVSCCKINPRRGAILQKMMDFSLFKDPIFMMYATSNFLTSIGLNVPYVFTVVGCQESWCRVSLRYICIRTEQRLGA